MINPLAPAPIRVSLLFLSLRSLSPNKRATQNETGASQSSFFVVYIKDVSNSVDSFTINVKGTLYQVFKYNGMFSLHSFKTWDGLLNQSGGNQSFSIGNQSIPKMIWRLEPKQGLARNGTVKPTRRRVVKVFQRLIIDLIFVLLAATVSGSDAKANELKGIKFRRRPDRRQLTPTLADAREGGGWMGRKIWSVATPDHSPFYCWSRGSESRTLCPRRPRSRTSRRRILFFSLSLLRFRGRARGKETKTKLLDDFCFSGHDSTIDNLKKKRKNQLQSTRAQISTMVKRKWIIFHKVMVKFIKTIKLMKSNCAIVEKRFNFRVKTGKTQHVSSNSVKFGKPELRVLKFNSVQTHNPYNSCANWNSNSVSF